MSKSQDTEAINHLKTLLKPGDTVYTQLNHVSRTGMNRVISVKIIKKNRPIDITWWVGQATGYKMHRDRDGLSVGGAGMDMGFHLVYGLGRVLWPKGFKHNKNTHHRNGDTSPRDNDGGYALNQEWL